MTKNIFWSFVISMNNEISFKSRIRIVSPKRFEKLSHKIFHRNGEFVSYYNLDTPFGYKDFQPYRVNMNEGFTLGVRSCTAAIVTAKNKAASLFMHLFNSKTNIRALDKIKKFFVGDSCILVGSKKICPHSKKLFNCIESIASKAGLPMTKMKDLNIRLEAHVAYKAKDDTLFLCVQDIINHKNYARTIKDLKLAFKEFKVSEKYEIIPINPVKEFIENFFNL